MPGNIRPDPLIQLYAKLQALLGGFHFGRGLNEAERSMERRGFQRLMPYPRRGPGETKLVIEPMLEHPRYPHGTRVDPSSKPVDLDAIQNKFFSVLTRPEDLVMPEYPPWLVADNPFAKAPLVYGSEINRRIMHAVTEPIPDEFFIRPHKKYRDPGKR